MDLLKETREICNLYDIKPARSKGQNFLIKEDVYNKIVSASELQKDDTVLEVGPGLGFLTAKLATAAKEVIAVELDDRLAGVLETGLKAKKVENVKVVNGNILDIIITNDELRITNKFQTLNFGIKNYKIVANLPYNITSVFLRKFLSSDNKPDLMVLMLQKEVAERICAQAGKMSILSVSVQFYAEPKIISIVPADSFWPMPEVDSAIIRLKPHPQPPLLIRRGEGEVGRDEKNFFRLVKIGFSAKRKMLKNNLAAGFNISQKDAGEFIKKAGLNEKIRPQELSLDDWLLLDQALTPNPSPAPCVAGEGR